ncbi:MAG: ABC transporter permease subunit [Ancrocorticia sp.]
MTTTHATHATPGAATSSSNNKARASEYKKNRLTLAGVVRSEWIKALSLRSIRWTLAVSILLGVAMSAITAFALNEPIVGSALPMTPTEYVLAVIAFPGTLLSFVFAILGVFVFSSEYASGMILSTLTAAPRRGYVIAAKALVLTVISALGALIVVGAGVGISVLQIPEVADVLGTEQVVTGMLGTVFFLVAIALFAFAVAGIVRSTAGAITVVVGILFLVPMILQIMTGFVDWNWLVTVQNYLPMTLGSNLGNGVTEALSLRVQMEQADSGYAEVLSYRDSALSLALWVIIPMAAAVKLFFSRDAK